MSPTAAQSPARRGLPRAENGARVRRALVDAALELFATKGYDTTTTIEIAAAAGVSPRTFFRYFATKESVVFFGEYDFVRSFADVYLSQPEDLSELAAMAAAFGLLAPGVTRLRARVSLYRRAVASSTLLRGREREVDDENAATVAQAIATRRRLAAPDRSCELQAHLGMTVLRLSLNHWLDDPPGTDIAQLISANFGVVARFTGGSALS
jgi:AcrR family transcriptional regulator